MPPTRPLAERFWAKVDKRGPDECWEWTGARQSFGYGRIGVGAPSRDTTTTQRVSWELHFGPIPDRLHVCHRCDNPPCVNPAHLFLGTAKDNMGDAKAKGRASAPPHRRGSANSQAKLTEANVVAIRARLRAGESARALGREYGVSHTAIRYAASGRNWSLV